jgi:pSer/pThr/pTyr-binding forkhead associated (FHA) protein
VPFEEGSMPEIIVKYEEKVIEKFITEKKRVTIGRTPDNDIILDNRGVSRRHSQIEFGDDQAVIIDNESLNGTFVNSRRISEDVLKDNDIITIGKYSLIYHSEPEKSGSPFDADGTMVLQTKKQRELIAKDQKDKELTALAGASVLLGEAGADFEQFPLNRSVITIGKSSLANVKAKGMFLSGIQAKIVHEDDGFWVVNLGKKGKTRINGEEIDRYMLRNDDIIQVGKTVYRFVESRS